MPSRNDPLTPTIDRRREADDTLVLKINLPNCCFPAYRPDGKPSHVRVLLPKHPIVKGIPHEFDIPHTEMYDEPFHVPRPDEVVFEEPLGTPENISAAVRSGVSARGACSIFVPATRRSKSSNSPKSCRSLRTPPDGWGVGTTRQLTETQWSVYPKI